MSPRISSITRRCAPVSWYGRLELAGQLARAGQRRQSALPPRRLPQQHQRELVGEDLIIGEAPSRASAAGSRWASANDDRHARHASRAEQARLDPLGQLRRALERLADKLPDAPVRQAFGKRIDRLADRGLRPLPGFSHLGMDDLPFVAIGFELAGDGALLAHRQAAASPSRDC